MTGYEFLSYLHSLGVELTIDGDQLRYSAPEGVLTPALRAELVARKTEMIALLRQAALVKANLFSPIKRVPREGDLPLSFAQERLWFLDQLAPGNPGHNLTSALRLRFPLNVPALHRSLNEIARRHETLCTTFVVVDGQPVQRIVSSLDLALPMVDLRSLPFGEREAAAKRLVAEEALKLFDLQTGPLVRAVLLHLGMADYLFVLTMHHIISDGWSLHVFSRELHTLYSAFAFHQPSPLRELPIQYADFAVWQRKWLQGAVLEEHLDYWKRQLADLPVLQLPMDHPRPEVQSFDGASHSHMLPAELATALKELSQKEEATLFMILLAAFQALLARYSGQDDIVVGTYIANRNRAEIEDLIGFFVNTLVLRTDLSGNPTFRQMLGRVKETTLGAYAHQNMPFPKLVEALQPSRDLSRNPLFQVVFQLLNILTTNSRPRTGVGEPVVELERTTADFDLVLHVSEDAQQVTFEYNRTLFSQDSIVRMAGHYQRLLEAVVAAPDQHLHSLPLMTPEVRDRVLVEWNATARDYPFDCSVVQLFEMQAAQSPRATAVIADGHSLSYGELNRRANQLAHHLRMLGAGPEMLVGICLERSPDVFVALLGVFKTGAAYLPLDANYPQERLAYMLADSQASMVITMSRLSGTFSTDHVNLVLLDADGLQRQPDTNPDVPITPDDLAYAIYTSGSTGKPKGVTIEHRQILNRLAWMWDAYPFGPGEVACQKTALSFVDSLWELLGGLLQGIPTVIIPDGVVRDPQSLVKALAEHRVTRLWVVPSLLRALLNSHSDLQQTLPALTFWVTTGEPITADLVQRFGEALPHAVLYNVYGTSEVWDVTWYEPDGTAPSPFPIGRPISNMQTYILDPSHQPVPVGVIGEFHVGGVGLGRGYLNQARLIAERFIPHPFSPVPGQRLYRTGDLARFLPDGNIEFLGRVDHQLKIRGFRVEPGEIEAVLKQHSGVGNAVVVAREAVPGDIRLAAYYVSAQGSAPSANELHRWLQRSLPDYMVPAHYVLLESLPLTPSGKINRLALPDPGKEQPFARPTLTAPRTALEEVLAAVFAEILGLEDVGVEDDFFADLGGHSLLATRLVSHVSDLFVTHIPLLRFFESPTVAGFAAAMTQDEAERTRLAKTAELLLRLSQMEDDEVQAMLSQQAGRQSDQEAL